MGLAALTGRADDFSSCFIPGEVVEYKIYWMGLPLAWSTISTEAITEDGRELIRLRMVAQTYGAYEHIFKVDDVSEVIIDPKTALPIRLDFNLNEGTIHKSHLTTFYHDRKIAIFQDRISKDIREVPIESDTRELFSFMYAHRYQDPETLGDRKYKVLVNGKMYDLAMKTGEKEDIKLSDYGKVPSIEIEPLAEFDGIFIRKGKISFWISTKDRHMVTCIKAKVAVGKIRAILQQVSGPGDDFWSRK